MLKTRRTKHTFSPEFKLEAIEQVIKYQRDAREVAQILELNPDHLRKWIRLYKQELQGGESAGNAITPEQREIQLLKAKWPVLVLCHLFGIHRSVYYAQVKRPVNVQRIELRSRVRAFHALSLGSAGNDQPDVTSEWR